MASSILFPSIDGVECIGSLLVRTDDLEEFSYALQQQGRGARLRRELTVKNEATHPHPESSLLVRREDTMTQQGAGPAKLQKWITQQFPRAPSS
mmetsp:Transcript_131392/g.195726  ORF Transcript_131392/g.195726 Transcript_131392/m.195726 type:complete len:94 (-) Transcript_131392:150-431(-)|eukprot:CAMPEP_0117049096 /NCGR_PEP_ID=MMETSP0472-20121206/33935_1 /TAXON_ID=693140 ORGANISM="Tiarina fusus, Strain LIS" /NCGR_SAMPLE_ID=MMETSP0472 /ASSEMBLY_ACC=CAM_ASM_000603 /LENGTH=93 /DNA_ID=CAMNT_0004762441 /DNA_START=68 /DNA_END=349 /DNA_ORIENTATION=-